MTSDEIIPQERILMKIISLRGEKVILDLHLAELYNVENRALKQAVRRNIDMFPADFMFVLTEKELKIIVSEKVVTSKQHFGGANPFAFTETGVAMLSSVLKSKRAKEMNVAIMRSFIALRKITINYADLVVEIEKISKKVIGQDHQINLIFKYLKQLEEVKKQEPEYNNRKRIGFKTKNTKEK